MSHSENPSPASLLGTQSYVAGQITEFVTGYWLAFRIMGVEYNPSAQKWLQTLAPVPDILKGINMGEVLASLAKPYQEVLRANPKQIDGYLDEGIAMAKMLERHLLDPVPTGIGLENLETITSIEMTGQTKDRDDGQADLMIHYRTPNGTVLSVGYSAKSGRSAPAAQGRGIEQFGELTNEECRYAYMYGVASGYPSVQQWLMENPIQYPTMAQDGVELHKEGQVLSGLMTLQHHIAEDGGIDMSVVPQQFRDAYREWNTQGNVAMCELLLTTLEEVSNGMCLAYQLVYSYLELAEQCGSTLYLLQEDVLPHLQDDLLKACISIRTLAESGQLAGQVRRKKNRATWVICTLDGESVLTVMLTNGGGRNSRVKTPMSIPHRLKLKLSIGSGSVYTGDVLAIFGKATCRNYFDDLVDSSVTL
jgi:hypothetical protein